MLVLRTLILDLTLLAQLVLLANLNQPMMQPPVQVVLEYAHRSFVTRWYMIFQNLQMSILPKIMH